MKIDWMTLAIEAVGVAIFFIWIVIPIREFRVIFKRLKHREAAGFPVQPVDQARSKTGAAP